MLQYIQGNQDVKKKNLKLINFESTLAHKQ